MITPESSSPWAVSIKQNLLRAANRHGNFHEGTLFKITPSFRRHNEDHYSHELISVGLYDRSMEDNTRGAKYRLWIANEFLNAVSSTDSKNDWDKLFAQVVKNPREMQELYADMPDSLYTEDDIRSILGLDAIFLACYLSATFVGNASSLAHAFSPFRAVVDQSSASSDQSLILHDLMKVDNQIPLSLIREALQVLFCKIQPNDHEKLAEICFHQICSGMVRTFLARLPGYQLKDEPIFVDFKASHHFLNCLHQVMYFRLETSFENGNTLRTSKATSWQPNEVDLNSFPSLKRLRRAGIHCRGLRSGRISDVYLENGWLKAIVYIPRFPAIEDKTETLWRNIVAYESTLRIGKQHFTQLLQFMGNLIDDEYDVELLRRGQDPVIGDNLLNDNEAVATLFSSVLKNRFVDASSSQLLVRVGNEIRDCYSRRSRLRLVRKQSCREV